MTASPLRMRILGLMFVGILLSLVVISPLGVKSTDVAQAGSPNAIQNLPGCLQNLLPIEDDNSSGPVNPGFQLKLANTTYNTLYVNNNGNVTFGSPLDAYTPFGL